MTAAEKYFAHLDDIFQKEPLFFPNESLIDGLPGVTAIVYKDMPEAGYITGITYGLSLINHPIWKHGRPELSITVKSENVDWGMVLGYIANHGRGNFDFCYGQIINFKERIHEESEMDAFLIFTPSILERKDFLNIDIGKDYLINIAGLHPIYSEEIAIYEKIGLEAFWHHPNFGLYDINRKRITT